MTRVCILTSGHSPYDDRVFYKEAISLKKAGFNVRLICSTGNYAGVSNGIRIQGFLVSPLLIRIGVGRILKLMHFVRASLAGGDIYHCHEFGVLLAAHVVKWIRNFLSRNVVCVVYDMHEWFPWSISWETDSAMSRRVRLWFYCLLHSFLCKRTDYIIVNQHSKVRLFSQILVQPRIVVVQNYPLLQFFSNSQEQLPKDRFVIAYAGGLSKERGIFDLATATQTFSSRHATRVQLLLIGDFYSADEKNEFLQTFDAVDYELKLTGWVAHPRVSRMLRDADVCTIPLHPTKRFLRSLPVKLYEYMALSKPIVATNLPETSEVVERSQCGLVVDPTAPHALADAIHFYYAHPAERDAHGRNGRKWVEKQFNWAKCEKRLLSVYASLQRQISSTNV